MNDTNTRALTEILADLNTQPGPAAEYLYRELETAVRSQLQTAARHRPDHPREVTVMNDTITRTPAEILADLHTQPGPAAEYLYRELETAVRKQVTLAARMAPPVPGVTRNAGYTVRAVLPGHPAGGGLLESWWVAAEDSGSWVTWEAYALDNPGREGQLAYNAGHYFTSPAAECKRTLNRQRALADLAVRAGLMAPMALLIADAVEHQQHSREDVRMAGRLRRYFT